MVVQKIMGSITKEGPLFALHVSEGHSDLELKTKKPGLSPK